MDEDKIIEKFKIKILNKYNVKNKSFEDWIEDLVQKNSFKIIRKTTEDIQSKENEFENSEDINKIKYKETLRGLKKRRHEGKSCKCCEKYFNSDKKRLNKSSRHRNINERPTTPTDFWETDFN